MISLSTLSLDTVFDRFVDDLCALSKGSRITVSLDSVIVTVPLSDFPLSYLGVTAFSRDSLEVPTSPSHSESSILHAFNRLVP